MRKLTILIVVILIATILGGCITDSDVNKYNKYSGIEEKDISDLNDRTKTDFVYIYKGSSDNWAATYYIYRFKGEENHVTRLFMKYVGEESAPTGQLSYSYKTEGSAGNGDMLAGANSQVYNLGQGGGTGLIPRKDAIVSFRVNWSGKSESFELKSDK
jgi:hypothetical protein